MPMRQRKRLRLQHYDYSQGASFFITICTKNREALLGTVGHGLDHAAYTALSPYGAVVEAELLNINQHFPHIVIDNYCIMPNHIHIIITIIDPLDGAERSRPFPTLSTVVGLFKSGVSRKMGFSLWQTSFHEHIIRNQTSYQEISSYIDHNPYKWREDCYYVPTIIS